ncbi:MAG: HlyD family efflux transporter periplasmic adaptor subunit [Pseudomonadota bacterium]
MDRPLLQAWWQRPLWRRLAIATLVLLLLVIAAVVLLGPAQRSLRMARAAVSIASVEHGLYHDFIPLRGEAVPRDTVYLDALEGGLVSRVLVQAGDRVVTGQPLVEFSNTALELEVLDREGSLVQSLTQLQTFETQLEQNRAGNERLLSDAEYDVTRLQRALTRREELIAQHLISIEERDQLRDQLDSALRKRELQKDSNDRQETLRVQQLPQVKAQMSKLQESLAITHDKLRNLTVRAPVAGLVTAMDLKIGENRNRGQRLAEITPDTGFKLSATVDEYYLGRVREGQVARVERDGRPWQLKVTRVYPQVKDGGFIVDLAFDGATPDGLLRGQSLQGRLSLGDDQPGVILASGAFLERSGGDWVFVLAADGKSATRRRVKLGRRNAEQVEVLSGLAPGERVIISDYAGLERIDRIGLE